MNLNLTNKELHWLYNLLRHECESNGISDTEAKVIRRKVFDAMALPDDLYKPIYTLTDKTRQNMIFLHGLLGAIQYPITEYQRGYYDLLETINYQYEAIMKDLGIEIK